MAYKKLKDIYWKQIDSASSNGYSKAIDELLTYIPDDDLTNLLFNKGLDPDQEESEQ